MILGSGSILLQCFEAAEVQSCSVMMMKCYIIVCHAKSLLFVLLSRIDSVMVLLCHFS